jgi:2-polyprenyl-3-methyl-5-hydroxy-6-metoxy-1,4-benzoquinol methylase
VTKSFYDTVAMGRDFHRNPVLAAQAAQFRTWIDGHTSQLDVLDLGCGGGTPTRHLMADADRFNVIGADLSRAAVDAYVADTGRAAVQLDAQRLPFGPDRFDLVVSDDVIEHLVDTDSYAREIRRVLRPGGWLLLSTPNLAAWFNRLSLLVGVQPAFTEVSFEKIFGRPGDDIVGHLRLFTSRAIREFLVHHGFELVDVRGVAFEALPRWIAPLDRLVARVPSLAGNTVIVARSTR